MDSVRSLYRVFGFGSLAITVVGLLACAAVVYIALYREVTWARLIVITSFAWLLLMGGVWSLWERWLSFGVVEGLRKATFSPRTSMHVLAFVVLCSLTIALFCAATFGSLSEGKERNLAWGLAACSLLCSGIPLAFLFGSPRYRLVREGIAVRHRGGHSLIPWDAIRSGSFGTWSYNPVVAIQLDWQALSTPLRTVWRRELTPEEKGRIQQKLLKSWITAERWGPANLMILSIACMMPAGVFFERLNEALRDPVARDALSPFSDSATGSPVSAPMGE